MAAGGGFNAMVAARRCGMEVVYAGGLGSGPFAGIAERAMRDEAISILRPPMAGMDQGCCTTLVDARGERTFIAAEGADGARGMRILRWLPGRPGDWLLLSGYALSYRNSREALARWLDRARGTALVFDPSPVVAAIPAPILAAACHAALWISANAEEARVLTGERDPAEAAAALARGRPPRGGAVVRDGARGCHLALPGAPPVHLPGHAVTAIDTNGAGDAHVGAFIAALARDEAPAHAARLANVAAALSTTREGPSTARRLKRFSPRWRKRRPPFQQRN